jgi:putative Mg2+ transporter-C (MgtC) family protein
MQLPEQMILKILLSVCVGALIGAEREYRSKSAGFRTLTLICLGAALFTAFSQEIGAKTSPDRIASNVVVGIGFVGAGVIFKFDYGVQGITTAAMIWVTAALGMGIGAGYFLVSGLTCVLILLVLVIFTQLEGWIDRINQIRNYKITCDYQNETLHRYENYLKEQRLKFKRNRELKSGGKITGEWMAQGPEDRHLRFINQVLKDPSVTSFEF